MNCDLFITLSAAMRNWLDVNKIADIAEIQDEEVRRFFYIIMEECESEPAWGNGKDPGQLKFMKKASLFACSKIGNDGAYSHVFRRIMKRAHEERLFVGA